MDCSYRESHQHLTLQRAKIGALKIHEIHKKARWISPAGLLQMKILLLLEPASKLKNPSVGIYVSTTCVCIITLELITNLSLEVMLPPVVVKRRTRL